MLLYAWFAVLVVDKQRARAHTLFELSTQQTRGPNSVRALEYPNRRRQRARNHECIVRGLFDVLCMCGVVFVYSTHVQERIASNAFVCSHLFGCVQQHYQNLPANKTYAIFVCSFVCSGSSTMIVSLYSIRLGFVVVALPPAKSVGTGNGKNINNNN